MTPDLRRRWQAVFSDLTRAARDLRSARAAGGFAPPDQLAERAREFHALVAEILVYGCLPPLSELGPAELALYRAAVRYGELRSGRNASRQWAALLDLVAQATDPRLAAPEPCAVG